jgi:hypothetical protein
MSASIVLNLNVLDVSKHTEPFRAVTQGSCNTQHVLMVFIVEPYP